MARNLKYGFKDPAAQLEWARHITETLNGGGRIAPANLGFSGGGGKQACPSCGHLIQDATTTFPQRSILQFTGDGVSCSDDGSKTILTFGECAGSFSFIRTDGAPWFPVPPSGLTYDFPCGDGGFYILNSGSVYIPIVPAEGLNTTITVAITGLPSGITFTSLEIALPPAYVEPTTTSTIFPLVDIPGEETGDTATWDAAWIYSVRIDGDGTAAAGTYPCQFTVTDYGNTSGEAGVCGGGCGSLSVDFEVTVTRPTLSFTIGAPTVGTCSSTYVVTLNDCHSGVLNSAFTLNGLPAGVDWEITGSGYTRSLVIDTMIGAGTYDFILYASETTPDGLQQYSANQSFVGVPLTFTIGTGVPAVVFFQDYAGSGTQYCDLNTRWATNGSRFTIAYPITLSACYEAVLNAAFNVTGLPASTSWEVTGVNLNRTLTITNEVTFTSGTALSTGAYPFTLYVSHTLATTGLQWHEENDSFTISLATPTIDAFPDHVGGTYPLCSCGTASAIHLGIIYSIVGANARTVPGELTWEIVVESGSPNLTLDGVFFDATTNANPTPSGTSKYVTAICTKSAPSGVPGTTYHFKATRSEDGAVFNSNTLVWVCNV